MILSYVLLGLLIGVVSGTLGIGGGVLLIPIFMWLYGYDQAKATGTTLGVLVPPVVLPAAYQYFQRDELDVSVAVFVAVGFAVGGFAGAAVRPYVSQDIFRFAFGLMLIYIGVQYVIGRDTDARSAAAGVVAVGLSWLSYFGLRALGRRYRPRQLPDEIRRRQERPPDEPEYYI